MRISFVVMAGGAGTRFWPASRVKLPKQFLPIIGGEPMVRQTVNRLEGLSGDDDVIMVINDSHADLVRRILHDKEVRLMLEPVGRNTAPCIGLAAMLLGREDPHRSMVVLPADHYVANVESFRHTLMTAADLATRGDIVTIGIVPTSPETGYGYIHKGDESQSLRGISAMRVERFVEKPSLDLASQYVSSGQYLWNAGIFAFTPATILAEIETYLPDVYQQLVHIEKAFGSMNFNKAVHDAYQAMPSISIDYGILEKTKRPIWVIPGDFGWSDVGHWESLYQLRQSEQDHDGNVVQGRATLLGTRNSMIYNTSKQLIVANGVEDILVVSTDEVTLVAKRQDSESLRAVVSHLKEGGLDKYL